MFMCIKVVFLILWCKSTIFLSFKVAKFQSCKVFFLSSFVTPSLCYSVTLFKAYSDSSTSSHKPYPVKAFSKRWKTFA